VTDACATPQKIAVVLRDDLPTWQALNATAFLSGAVGVVAGPDLVLAGLALVGSRNAVDKSVKGAVLHP
jgi:hypothetical protein